MISANPTIFRTTSNQLQTAVRMTTYIPVICGRCERIEIVFVCAPADGFTFSKALHRPSTAMFVLHDPQSRCKGLTKCDPKIDLSSAYPQIHIFVLCLGATTEVNGNGDDLG